MSTTKKKKNTTVQPMAIDSLPTGKKTTGRKPKTTTTTTTTTSTTSTRKKKSGSTSKSTKKKAGDQLDNGDIMISDSEEELDYFSFKADTGKTSSRTLADTRLLDGSEVASLLDSMPEKHQELKAKLLEKYSLNKSHEMWNDLTMGYNLLLYGYGSKKELINQFRNRFCLDGPHIEINGYLPIFNIKDLLYCISNKLFLSNERFSTPIHHVEHIKALFEAKANRRRERDRNLTSASDMATMPNGSFMDDDEEHIRRKNFELYDVIYLIIHNIDGVSVRHQKIQKVLGSLAEIPNIRIIASIDHVNSPILWDLNMTVQFNWMWHDVPTFAQYTVETAYELSLLFTRGQKMNVKSVVVILRSLTPNARSIFKVLLEYLIGNKEKRMSFNLLFDRCVDMFLISSEAMLRAMLVEFTDHGVILNKVEAGESYFIVPVAPTSLGQILTEMKELDATTQ
ncbi:hypothetical protein SAMD00019534_060520 [Acytostelium subglobosum LB1]|uniref:hypothetical protein n=1 Tax=Acytostelium subglobosum LB1 TaxID=1410327 RepID=UPI00064498CC|nr:hypothetical protein SAMD00019534_060520 [Acytostelium subglobosum LB1]GAM22877.1 hypothetical protein SAMD00019534_060520 [Acytostelium subglobosum LB1]|eukprot:XP_012754104.1 hypothetical protein SAMD00019534_060520 [Acytostelium subglobosum LB1]